MAQVLSSIVRDVKELPVLRHHYQESAQGLQKRRFKIKILLQNETETIKFLIRLHFEPIANPTHVRDQTFEFDNQLLLHKQSGGIDRWELWGRVPETCSGFNYNSIRTPAASFW